MTECALIVGRSIEMVNGKPVEKYGSLYTAVGYAPPDVIEQANERERLAKQKAQEGIQRAVEHAEREVKGWADLGFRYVRLYATRHRGERFIGYDVVQASIAEGIIQPPNARAWGGPLQRAARAEIIVKVGTAADPNRHGNPVILWRAA